MPGARLSWSLAGTRSFKISYTGGTGNDVTLTALAPLTVPLPAPVFSPFGQALFVGVIFLTGVLSLRRRGDTV
jgi:hypothetical protein